MKEDFEKDRLFIQEIINDLERYGYIQGGKAQTLLRDWSAELRDKSHMTGRTKKVFNDKIGKELW